MSTYFADLFETSATILVFINSRTICSDFMFILRKYLRFLKKFYLFYLESKSPGEAFIRYEIFICLFYFQFPYFFAPQYSLYVVEIANISNFKRIRNFEVMLTYFDD